MKGVNELLRHPVGYIKKVFFDRPGTHSKDQKDLYGADYFFRRKGPFQSKRNTFEVKRTPLEPKSPFGAEKGLSMQKGA